MCSGTYLCLLTCSDYRQSGASLLTSLTENRLFFRPVFPSKNRPVFPDIIKFGLFEKWWSSQHGSWLEQVASYVQLTDTEMECDGILSEDRSPKFNTSDVPTTTIHTYFGPCLVYYTRTAC